jgi:hypothetical protein
MNPQSQYHREQIELLCAPYRKDGEKGYVIPEQIALLVDQHERAAAAIEEDDAEPNEADGHALRAEGLEMELQGSKATVATYQLQVVTLAGQLELASEANREWEAKALELNKRVEFQAEQIRQFKSGIVDARSTMGELSQVTASELNDLQARWQKTEDQRFAACEQVENLEGSLRVAVGDLGQALMANGKLESCCRHWKAVAVRGMRIMRNRLDRAEADLTLAENDRDSYADQLDHVRQNAAKLEAAGREACEALAGATHEPWERIDLAESTLHTTFARDIDIARESWCSSLVLAMTNELAAYRQAEHGEISSAVDPNSDTQAERCQGCGHERELWEGFNRTGNDHTGGGGRWLCGPCYVALEQKPSVPPPQDLNDRLAGGDEGIEAPPNSASDLLDATDERFERTEYQLPVDELLDQKAPGLDDRRVWGLQRSRWLSKRRPAQPAEPLPVVPRDCNTCANNEGDEAEEIYCEKCHPNFKGPKDSSFPNWSPNLGSAAQPTPEPPSATTEQVDSQRPLDGTGTDLLLRRGHKYLRNSSVTPPEAILFAGRSCDGKSEIPSSNPVTEPTSNIACQNMAKRLDTLTPERGTSSLARRVLDKIAKVAGLAPDEDLALRVLVKRPVHPAWEQCANCGEVVEAGTRLKSWGQLVCQGCSDEREAERLGNEKRREVDR